MRKMQTPKWVKNYGLSTLVAGFVFLLLPMAADASDFGDELLSDGIENEHVEQLQDLLIAEGHLDQASADGLYNEATSEAVKSYQEENDLLADGLAGPQTLGALKTLEEGDENALVTDLQETLDAAGHYNGSVDGYFDEETYDAVKDFQAATDIAVDGLAGPETFSTLYYSTTEDAKEEEEPESEGAADDEAANEETAEAADEASVEQETNAEAGADEGSTESDEASAETTEETTSNDNESSSESPEGTTYQMEATAYTAECNGCSGITANGTDLRNDRNANVVAVDPNVIPLGTTVHVEGYGEAVAADTGGAINGEKIDLHVPTKEEAMNFGRQNVEVTVLD
ncbi:peptidoglycan-binding protein [Natribacillus halophilus]|uniref:3D (Asp-Asp-Asp) domain-containing protein n=1 Tax=Natribacillus halophilus TaxID=549003 RepID=A0A1G8R2S6_9BACI|nr:peptidoglycan-binding protein [Natribacillus halophilus]SDJ11258.1 3D (Asp-Asp-Asp) domain-containing protein [Natribacillus halophilus]